jgi:hypothetical protein
MVSEHGLRCVERIVLDHGGRWSQAMLRAPVATAAALTDAVVDLATQQMRARPSVEPCASIPCVPAGARR